MRLRDVAPGAHVTTLIGHSHDVLSVAFSPNGWSLVSGSVDGAVRLWSSTTEASTATLKGHFSGVRKVAFSLEDRMMALSNCGMALQALTLLLSRVTHVLSSW